MLVFLKRLCSLVIQVQIRIGQFCTGLPFWKDVERYSMIIAGPVQAIAGTALYLFPFLRRFEAYLEVESLKKRPPVILALSITILAFRGILTSPNGHIGTDTSVFPFLTLVSCFNPFLGALSAISFGAADLLQKIVKPDIYGAMKWSDPNYYGALGGYLVAYSITIWMGVMPGLMSRVGRKIAIGIFLKIRAKRAAAHADGATPALSDPDVDGVGLLGNMLGAMITAFTGVKFVAPVLEWPAFHWRPTPDISCYKAELVTLNATAHRSALMGVVGGAVAATTPPPESGPPPAPGEVNAPIPPIPPPAIPQQVIHRDGEINEQGDVWSEEDRGWVGRDLYERNKKRVQWLADKAVADRHAGQSEDVKQAYDKWQDSNKKLAEVQEQGRLLEKKEKLREWVEQSEKNAAEQSYWSDVKNNFVLNVEKEFNELPQQTFELCREAAKAAKAGVDIAVDIAKDATNWEILRATGAQTAKDLIGSPIQSVKRVNKLYTEAAKKVGGAVVHMVAHPVETLKAVTGYDNWAKALDPNVPLAKRMGYALMGTVDTVSTFGGALVTKPGAVAAHGLEAADKLVDAAKAEMLANKLDDAARLGGSDLARHEAWLAGEQAARDRVTKLAAANTKGEVRDAVLMIQGDKRALQMMNRQGKGMKGAFNEEIRSIYKQTDVAVEKRLKDSLAQKGMDFDRYELKPTHATNPSKDPFKIGADRDITYSIYDKKTGQWMRDVPADKLQNIYNEEFYRTIHGARPSSFKEAAEFAQKMDQQCVDALHKEAYGRGPADLKTALHEPGTMFRDPGQIGKAVAYKSHEWYERAENAMRAGKAMEAEKLMSEGFRQTTKQFDNMLVRRHGALAEAGAQGLNKIPERMQEAIGALKSAEKGVSPIAIEKKLQELGYTSPREVATDVGEYIEAMDKLRPPIKPTGGSASLRYVPLADPDLLQPEQPVP